MSSMKIKVEHKKSRVYYSFFIVVYDQHTQIILNQPILCVLL